MKVVHGLNFHGAHDFAYILLNSWYRISGNFCCDLIFRVLKNLQKLDHQTFCYHKYFVP